jgi:hypothetical protein
LQKCAAYQDLPTLQFWSESHYPFWSYFPFWLEVGITGHNFGRGPSKDHSTKVWLQLAQWFLKRRLKCEMLTDGRNQIKPNLAGMVPGWVPFKIMSDSPALHSRWLLLLKIEISSIVHCCFIINQNELQF